MKKLTDTAIQAALAKKRRSRVDLADGACSGLTLRIGQTRGATWSLLFRVVGEGGISNRGHARKGIKHRISLGSYPEVSLEAARAKANSYLDQAKNGISPTEAMEQVATARGLTVKALAEKFIADYIRMRQLRSLLKYEGAINVHIIPGLGNVLAEVLNREQVRTLIRSTMVRLPRATHARGRPRGGREAARTVLVVLRRMINWAIRERLLKRVDNPVSGMEDNLPKKRRKERVLSTEEAQIVWQAASTLGYPFGPVYQLILLSGCRPGEWANCKRQYVDLEQGLLVIPADAYKSDHVHVVPLVGHAVEILQDVIEHHPQRQGDYLFSGTGGEKGLQGWSHAHERMMKAMCAVSGERTSAPWTPHDLRRTVATRIAEQLGIGGEQIIKRVLGHSDGSVTAIYNRYGYVKEMRRVLEVWTADLTAAAQSKPRRTTPFNMLVAA